VSGNEDDEALTWAGGRDPSHYETPEVKPAKPDAVPKSKGKTARRGGPDADSHPDAAGHDLDGDTDDDTDHTDDEEVDEAAAPAMSSVVLIVLGILGGIYLLYTVGWFVSWQRLVYVDTNTLELAAFRAQQVLAIIAPPLWFIVTIVLTRGRKPTARLLWLLIGAILLVPWSFTFGR
jgi:hypothetical protein